MALSSTNTSKLNYLSPPNTATQERLLVPSQTQASPMVAKSLSPKIIDVVHAKENNPSWLGTSIEPMFAKKTEATSQEYRNPNADRDNPNVVRIDSELSSSDVVELDDTKANPEDVAQEVEIGSINPMETEAKSLTINLGEKDSLRPVEASVTNIQVGRDKKLTLSFLQTSSKPGGWRDIKISFPEKSLEKITQVLDGEQTDQLLALLKKDQNKGILKKFPPKLLESLGQKAPPKTMS